MQSFQKFLQSTSTLPSPLESENLMQVFVNLYGANLYQDPVLAQGHIQRNIILNIKKKC